MLNIYIAFSKIEKDARKQRRAKRKSAQDVEDEASECGGFQVFISVVFRLKRHSRSKDIFQMSFPRFDILHHKGTLFSNILNSTRMKFTVIIEIIMNYIIYIYIYIRLFLFMV